MQIIQELQERARREPDVISEVIITCEKYSDALQEELDRAGLETTSKEQAPYGLIYGRIRLSNVWNLKNISDRGSVEPDTTQHAL